MLGTLKNTTGFVARGVALVVVSTFALTHVTAAEEIPTSVDALFGVAKEHYSAGEWQSAIDRFNAILQSHPQDPRVSTSMFFTAEALMQLGRYREAFVLFREIPRNNSPQDRAARIDFRIGEAAFFANELDTARRKLQEYISHHPKDQFVSEATMLLGHTEQHLGRRDAALANYHAIIEQHSKSRQMPSALLAAASLHDQLKQSKGARKLYERFIRDFPKHPQLEEAVFRLGWLLREMGETDQETELWRLLNTTITTGRHWHEATYLLARRTFEQGGVGEAEQLVNAWLECDRTRHETANSDKLPNPDAPDNRRLHARVLYLQAQIAAAREYWSDVVPPLETLVVRFPDSMLRLPAQFWIAEANFRDGNYELAGQQFEQLSQKADGNEENWTAMIPLRQAQILARNGDWIAAFGLADAISGKHPHFALQYEVDYVLGRCLASRGELADAREAYRRVIDSPQGSKTETAVMAQWMIGETYLHQKNYAVALDEYLQAQEYATYPSWQARAALQAGTCYERMRKWREAEQLYAAAADKYAETEIANDLATRRDQIRKRSQIP